MTIRPSFLFDLDGTLVDSVYEHVLAWQEALTAEGIELSVWRIHRKIGMSGGLFMNQLLRETKLDITPDRVERLQRLHAEAYQRFSGEIRPLPGARALVGCFDGGADSVGDRDQRPHVDGRAEPAGAGRRPGGECCHHAR